MYLESIPEYGKYTYEFIVLGANLSESTGSSSPLKETTEIYNMNQ